MTNNHVQFISFLPLNKNRRTNVRNIYSCSEFYIPKAKTILLCFHELRVVGNDWYFFHTVFSYCKGYTNIHFLISPLRVVRMKRFKGLAESHLGWWIVFELPSWIVFFTNFLQNINFLDNYHGKCIFWSRKISLESIRTICNLWSLSKLMFAGLNIFSICTHFIKSH